jgi:hypothetical protein
MKEKSMSNATDLIKQRDELNEKIDTALKSERAAALVDVKATIKLHKFTQTELKSAITTRKRKSKKKAEDANS